MSQVAVRERWAMSVEAKALLLVSAGLLAFGLSVLYSASSIVAIQKGDPSTSFLMGQLKAALIGVVCFAVVSKLDAERWSDWAWYLMGGSLFLLAVIIFPLTPKSISPDAVYGSKRFLNIPGLGSLQPSEFAKLAVIVWTAMLVVRKGGAMRHLIKGLLPFFLIIGLLGILVGQQPDISMALTYLLIMLVVLYAAGARMGHFLFLGALGLPVLFSWIASHEYVMRRLSPLLHPGSGTEGIAPQLLQSLIAVGSGRLFGRGYGEGMLQAGWVPLGYNDFIGSVIGEELGFLGIVFVISCFSLYGYLGYRISVNARSRFQGLVAVGITFTMLSTAFIHMGVVTGLLMTTGLTLPFVSLGGSNLLLSLIMTGILVNIGSTREKVYQSADAALSERVPVVNSA